MQQQLTRTPPCSACGERLGKHKFGSNQCPNADWAPSNGKPQWRLSFYTTPQLKGLAS
jgi:hypothetical protein